MTRRMRCYCVGTGKTGTTSIAGLFSKNFTAAHEPTALELIAWTLKLSRGEATEEEVVRFLHRRDAELQLDMESDGTLSPFLHLLVREFPQSKFVLTVRDCHSWLASMINHALARKPEGAWLDYDNLVYGGMPASYSPEERDFADHGLRTIEQYLRHWSDHIDHVVNTVPAPRLLILRTDRLVSDLAKLAEFVGVDPGLLDKNKAHLNRNNRRFPLLAGVDPRYIDSKVDEHCGRWMSALFPGARKMEDAV